MVEYEYKRIIAGRGGGIRPTALEKMKSDGWILHSQKGLEYTFKRIIIDNMETKEHKQFKPFEKVLMRSGEDIWQIDFYSHWSKEKGQHITLAYGDGIVLTDRDILPYEGNEHLLGKADEPEEEIELKEGEFIMVSDAPIESQYHCVLKRFAGINSGISFKAKALDERTYNWRYAIRFSDFNPYDMEETKKHILCVKNGKIVRYYE